MWLPRVMSAKLGKKGLVAISTHGWSIRQYGELAAYCDAKHCERNVLPRGKYQSRAYPCARFVRDPKRVKRRVSKEDLQGRNTGRAQPFGTD